MISPVDKPHLTFEDDYVTVIDSTGRSAVKYYSDPDMLTSSGKEVQILVGS